MRVVNGHKISNNGRRIKLPKSIPTIIWTYILLFFFAFSCCKCQKSSLANSEYFWSKGSWGSCKGTKCGDGGVQLRAVTCVFGATREPTPNSRCDFDKKPKDLRSCFKVCPEHEHQFKWKTDEWNACDLVTSSPLLPEDTTSDPCGLRMLRIGIQKRNISCVYVNNEDKQIDDYVCESFSSTPKISQSCDLPCPQNCVLGEFGPWSDCSSTCGNGTQTRIRSVLALPRFGGRECEEYSQVRRCHSLPPCRRSDRKRRPNEDLVHNIKFGMWEECNQARPDLSAIQRKSRHRRILARINSDIIGKRRQHLTCLNREGEALGNSFTAYETCAVKRDCELSPWSEWTRCYAKCGRGGIKTRTRRVLTLPSGGVECDVLEQVLKCEVEDRFFRPCQEYTWVTGGWSQCEILDANATCGGGWQNRDVYCIIRNAFTLHQASTASQIGSEEGTMAWAKMQPEQDSYCNQNYCPSFWQECNVTCDSDCELSDWSEWSECAPEICNEDPWPMTTNNSTKLGSRKTVSGFKRRYRQPIIMGNKSSCPHLVEVIPCEEPYCARWHVIKTSPCQPNNGVCGTGKRTQDIECRNFWGQTVNDSVCLSDSNLLRTPPTLICYAPCGSDCVISDWSTWSPCSHECKKGRKEHGTQHRFREVVANTGPTGIECVVGDSLREKRPCNQHRCSVYYWDTGDWSQCLIKMNVPPETPSGVHKSDLFMSDEGNSSVWLLSPLSFPYSDSTVTCGKGYKIRDVACRKKDSGVVQDKLCGSAKPPTNEDCSLACKRDCVVSQWSAWTNCQDECTTISQDGITFPVSVYQKRHRVVVQHRSGSGLPCSIEMTQKRLCASSHECMLFKWHTMKWSPCLIHSGATSLLGGGDSSLDDSYKCIGTMTRNIECQQVSVTGEIRTVDYTYCVKFSKEAIPTAGRSCISKCENNVGFFEWKRKLGCRATIEEDGYYEEVTFDDSSITELQKTSRPIGSWSSCNVTRNTDDLWKRDSVDDVLCGTGVRTRALGCFIDGTDVMVDNSYCSYRNFQQEHCEIPCPVDCTMSSWGEWGRCGEINTGGAIDFTSHSSNQQITCGNGLKMRFQFFKSPAENGGRPCPILDSADQRYERSSCSTPCDEYLWLADKWNLCEIKQHAAYSNCGSGVQTRSVGCHKYFKTNQLGEFSQEVSELQGCDVDDMPHGARECNSACPGECVYSEWTEWSSCLSNNRSRCAGAKRYRTRYLLRGANASEPILIPGCDSIKKLREEEDCQLNDNCFHYRSAWTQWSSCFSATGAICGAGKRQRQQNCISSSGLPTHPRHCEAVGIAVKGTTYEECMVSCSVDCKVSKWSEWSPCSATCGNNVRIRLREIIRPPSPIGRACPALNETTPCPAAACFEWVLGKWSDCSIQGNLNCGIGVQYRSVQCQQHDGVEVPASLCKQQLGLYYNSFQSNQLKRDCNKACTGECHVTEWSSWSPCHMWCVTRVTMMAGLTTGVQTRSRVGSIVGQIRPLAPLSSTQYLSEVDCPLSETEERECDLNWAKCFEYKWKTGQYKYGQRPVWCERWPLPVNVSQGCYAETRPQDTLYCVQNCSEIKHGHCKKNGICGCRDNYDDVHQSNGSLVSCNEPKQKDQANVVKVHRFIPDEKSDVDIRSFIPMPGEQESTSSLPASTITTNIKKGGFFNNIELFDKDGKLKVWVYGVIAGLVVFVIFLIAVIYLIYASCCRRRTPKYQPRHKRRNKSSRKHKRRNNSSGSNVGVGYYDPGLRYANSGTVVSYGSSRSGFSYPDRYYDSDG